LSVIAQPQHPIGSEKPSDLTEIPRNNSHLFFRWAWVMAEMMPHLRAYFDIAAVLKLHMATVTVLDLVHVAFDDLEDSKGNFGHLAAATA
jgi:hypothetical protein